jgi:hypothetical protein
LRDFRLGGFQFFFLILETGSRRNCTGESPTCCACEAWGRKRGQAD